MLCLLPLLQAAGCRLRAAAPGEGPLADALRKQNVEVLPITLHDAAGTRLPLETCRAELAKLLKQTRPDLLHANSLSMARLSGPVAVEMRLPSVGHIRDIVGLSRRAVEDVNLHTALVAVSHTAREYHIAQGVDRQRLSVLYNGVDLNLYQPRPATGYLHRELNLPPTSQLLASIGQIGPRKGLDQLLLAMQHVVGPWPEAHLLIIGERLSGKDEGRKFERALHAMASETPLSGRVHFLGWRTDIPTLLPELTVLVHAARQEPLGRVLLEAAACGCSIVATNVGGTAEIFEAEIFDERSLTSKVGSVCRTVPGEQTPPEFHNQGQEQDHGHNQRGQNRDKAPTTKPSPRPADEAYSQADEIGAILVAPNNPQAMADAILEIRHLDRTKLQRHNRLRMEQRFSPAAAAQGLKSLWDQAVSTSPSQHEIGYGCNKACRTPRN